MASYQSSLESISKLSLIEQKLKTVNPFLFSKAYNEMPTGKRNFRAILTKTWKINKGEAIDALLLYGPVKIFLNPNPNNAKKIYQKYADEFAKSNLKIEKATVKPHNDKQKLFLETFMELNNVGIEMNSLQIKEIERIAELDIIKKQLIAEPTTEHVFLLWNCLKELLNTEIRLVQILAKKAEVQDKVTTLEAKMNKLEKKDSGDFAKALLIDIATSYGAQEPLFIGSPIELLFKSHKFIVRIKKSFYLSDMLRATANYKEEWVNYHIDWFLQYKDSKEVLNGKNR